MNSVGFKIFLALWNRMQGQATPHVHFRIADWLEARWRGGDKRLLLQAFRSCGKSTIVGLFAAWLLFSDPGLRIIVLAAEGTLARKMVRNVRRIIERHPLTAHLKPARADQWAADRFTVNRQVEWRDPSMLARDIGSNMTGSRADIIICDDVEVPATCETAERRTDLREKLTENDFVLTPGGTILYIGTPHTWYTIYADETRADTGEDRPFLGDYTRLTVPILTESGESAWPERFTGDDIVRLKRTAGPNKFASQMMLVPVNIADGRLDPALLQYYTEDIGRSAELGGLYLRGRRVVSCSAWWDPAFGRGGDASVLAVVFTDENGRIHLHHVSYIRTKESGEDEASQQCSYVSRIARELFIPCICVESNGIGKFLPAILRRELAGMRVPCTVREVSSRKAKDLRIMEAFDALMAARALNVHENVRATPFVTEMREWRPGIKGQKDDGLDAVAGALSVEPVRLNYERFSGRQIWHGAGAQNADTDFDV